MNAKVTITSLISIHELISNAIRRAKAPLIALSNKDNFSSFTSDDVLDFAIVGAERKLKTVLDLNDLEASPISAEYEHGVIEHIRIAWATLMSISGVRDVFEGIEDSDSHIADALASAIEDLDIAERYARLIAEGINE